jgi:hypothetical protein
MGFDAGEEFVLRTSSTGYIDAYLVKAAKVILHAITLSYTIKTPVNY